MGFEFPNIDPVAFYVGPLPIRWYALAYLAGFILGWRYALHLAGLDKEQRPNKLDVDDFLPWVIVGVIIGGRLGYVLFYQLDYYLSDPLEIFKVWHGGMSFHGGAAGVILALFIFPMIRKIPKLRLADIICACVPIGLFFGRIANFINGELFGKPGDVSWAMKFPMGGDVLRHPSQLYEAALEGLVLFLILLVLVRSETIRNKSGFVSGAFLAGYGIFRAFVERFREPDGELGLIWDTVSMGQLLSAPMIAAGIGLMIYAWMKPPEPAPQKA